MRGTPHERATLRREQGIIPAYAGNTGNVVARGFEKLDHPRVCGEHQCINRVHLLTGGSSPRMRGTHQSGLDESADRRIIPAYAGNTQQRYGGHLPRWDHPRVCGEHAVNDEHADTIEGSSPRMRGTP